MPWSRLVSLGVAVVWVAAVAGSSSLRVHARQARTVEAGVYTPAQAERGEAVYRAECGICHGAKLEGDIGPPLAGDDFLGWWSGYPLVDLFDKIYDTMPEQAPQSLTREQVAELVAFLLSANRFPTGTAELDAAEGALKEISFPVRPTPGSPARGGDVYEPGADAATSAGRSQAAVSE